MINRTEECWRSLLDRNQVQNFKQKKYNLCTLWRAQAYREAGDEPEALVRARAFQNVLKHLSIKPDEGLVFGNCFGLTSDSLPEGINEDGYQTLVHEHHARGQRDFWAGFDHSLADYPTLLDIGIGG